MADRDGRGRPGRNVRPNQTKLNLADVLRRRRTNLKEFIQSLGVSTYAGLEIWCRRLGVNPPTQNEFEVIVPTKELVNSPQEGVVVLEAPVLIDGESGLKLDDDVVLDSPEATMLRDDEPTAASQKKPRKKQKVV